MKYSIAYDNTVNMIVHVLQVLRSLSDVHRHPTDYFDHGKLAANIAAARRDGLPIVRDMKAFYSDSFPILKQRKGCSSNGVYMSSGCADWKDLQNLDSYFILTEFPKGVNPMSCFYVFKPSIRAFQEGLRLRSGPAHAEKEIFYHGGIFLVKGDYPQAQEFAGCLGARANYPDRHSHICKTDLSDLSFDLQKNRTTLDKRRKIRTKQKQCMQSGNTKQLLSANGLTEQLSVFEDQTIWVNPCLNIPPMNEHSEVKGMDELLLTALLRELTDGGIQELQRAIEQQSLPPHWSSLAQPRLSGTTNNLTGMGIEDMKHLYQLLPFVLSKAFLAVPPVKKHKKAKQGKQARRHIVTKWKDNVLEKYQARANGAEDTYNVFVAAAYSQKHVFAKVRASGSPAADEKSLNELDSALLAFRQAMLGAYPELCHRPNFLFGRHYKEAVRNYGVPALLSVCMEEMLHGLSKDRVRCEDIITITFEWANF